MKHVFTDERFPEFEVHNHGNNQFHVYQRGRDGRMEEVDVFTTHSDHPTYAITPEEATKRAHAYFERMAKMDLSGEMADRDDSDTAQLPGRHDRDHSDIFNSTEEGPSVGKNASLDDLMGGKVMTADDVMAEYDRAKAISDPGQRAQAMARVQSMSDQLESSAEELVRRLLA